MRHGQKSQFKAPRLDANGEILQSCGISEFVAESHGRWPSDRISDTRLRLAGQAALLSARPTREPLSWLACSTPACGRWPKPSASVTPRRSQLNWLEKYPGRPLGKRAQHGHVMRPTPFGTKVARAAFNGPIGATSTGSSSWVNGEDQAACGGPGGRIELGPPGRQGVDRDDGHARVWA